MSRGMVSVGVFAAPTVLLGTLLWVSSWVHALYASEPMWLVATYAEPYRSLAVVVLCVAGALIARWRGGWAGLVVVGLTLSVALELSSAVYYDQFTGQIFVVTPLGYRSEIDLPSTQDGICVEAELDGTFVWMINGQSFVVRLLPLPRRDAELKEALQREAPQACETAGGA